MASATASASASISSTTTSGSLKTCGSCQQTAEKMERCSACKEVFYCNTVCQLKAWPAHKMICKMPVAVKAATASATTATAAAVSILSVNANSNGALAATQMCLQNISLHSKPSYQVTQAEQANYGGRLEILALKGILNNGSASTKQQCRELGEYIFNEFKRQAKSSRAAGKLLKKISKDLGSEKHRYVKDACAGIGDEKWTWSSKEKQKG